MFCVLCGLKFNVAPVVNQLGLEPSGNLKRIWWCSTGPFAFLPIHAAGIYSGKEPLCLSDYAVSSYIPSLENLLAPPPVPVSAERFNMVAIIQPESHGETSLPSTRIELENIKKVVASNSLTILGDSSSLTLPSTIHDVLNQLPTASFVHFACHGTQNMISPLDSSLILEDGDLKLSMVMKTSIPHASLAFLSACETAKGDERIPDEALHMAATMVFAGFRGVVGTMWSILDEDAPIVAKEFYGYLFRKGPGVQPQSSEAAYALHLAVKKLRLDPAVGFRRWVPFMHMGV